MGVCNPVWEGVCYTVGMCIILCGCITLYGRVCVILCGSVCNPVWEGMCYTVGMCIILCGCMCITLYGRVCVMVWGGVVLYVCVLYWGRGGGGGGALVMLCGCIIMCNTVGVLLCDCSTVK